MKSVKFQRVGKSKWTPLQAKALQAHIDEWRQILAGTRWEAGRDNACCRAFNADQTRLDCRRCPIAISTGKVLCFGTPYQQWQKDGRPSPTGSGQAFMGYGAGNAKAKKAAQAFIGFMEDILAGKPGSRAFKTKKIKATKKKENSR